MISKKYLEYLLDGKRTGCNIGFLLDVYYEINEHILYSEWFVMWYNEIGYSYKTNMIMNYDYSTEEIAYYNIEAITDLIQILSIYNEVEGYTRLQLWIKSMFTAIENILFPLHLKEETNE